ncbi:sulfatase-like hydrolase/transferase [Propionibacteriaceae bacterium Y2011]|uniref:sulfatase-like hydrolase/transferase n=1 Tax=Microlunatus sp. Y2014 TaxID=3418488 RepID=UPI003B4576B8
MTVRPRRPNVLVLMSDEHRPDFLGHAGHPVVRTPRLDALATDAVVFTGCHTPSPICVPARQAMAAGLTPRNLGVEVMGVDESPPGTMTFARRFSQYGYQTACAGKLHYLGEDQMQGWRRRVGAEMETSTRFVPDREVSAFEGWTEPSAHKWSIVDEIRRSGVGDNPLTAEDEYALAGAMHVATRHFTDPHYGRAVPDNPLLLMLSLNEPHYPYASPREDLVSYYLERVEPFVDQQVFDHGFLGGRFVARVGHEVTRDEAVRASAAYCAMIESMDDRLGRLLDHLTALGQDLDDWVIVYTSDHGEMLGEHGVWEKQKFFDASVRVPLLIRYPKAFGSAVVSENVSLVDLFATLVDLAGIPCPDGLDSRSLVPLCEGTATDWPDEAISQFDRTNLMIKVGDLKYQWYAGDRSEVLFDLAGDPGELRNAVADPRHVEAVARFRRRRAELGFS